MARTLGHFSISQESDGYLLHIEDEDGEIAEYAATRDNLEEIAEAVDEQLERDEDEPIDEGEDDDLPDEG